MNSLLTLAGIFNYTEQLFVYTVTGGRSAADPNTALNLCEVSAHSNNLLYGEIEQLQRERGLASV